MSTRAIGDQPELFRFFQRCFHNPKWKPERFTVNHIQDGMEREQIYEISDFEDQGPEDFVAEVVGRVEGDAKAFSGKQKYIIRCFPENSRDSIDREFFSVDGALFDPHADQMSGPSEGPNERGLTTQLMRHLEAQARTYHSTFHTVLGTMQSMLVEQRQMIQDMSRERLETIRIAQELLDRKQERDIHLGRERIKDGLMLKGVEALNLMFPTLAFKMLGAKKEEKNGHTNGAAQPQESEGETGVRHFVSFLNSLSDEQKFAIFALLKDEQKMAFGELATTYKEKEGKFNTAELLALDWAIHGLLKGFDDAQMNALIGGSKEKPPILNAEQEQAFRAIYQGYGIRDKRATQDAQPDFQSPSSSPFTPAEQKPQEQRALGPDPIQTEPVPVRSPPKTPKDRKKRTS